jgi:uncharacterized membrane protein YfcA
VADLALLGFVGFLAQLVDGALGMAYGTISISALLLLGVAPVNASAAVHSAQVFTCAASAASHIWHGNVDWRLVWWLALPGILGAAVGAIFLSSVDGNAIRPWIAAYLGCLGLLILLRAFRTFRLRQHGRDRTTIPLGFGGALLDAIGGGGWGPIVTTTLISRGYDPRFTVGSVNVAEFLVKTSASATFLTIIGTTHVEIVAALVLGGLLAAPLGGYMARIIPTVLFLRLIGSVVLLLSGVQVLRFFGWA